MEVIVHVVARSTTRLAEQCFGANELLDELLVRYPEVKTNTLRLGVLYALTDPEATLETLDAIYEVARLLGGRCD